MIEFTEPQRVFRPDIPSTIALIQERCREKPDHIAFAIPQKVSAEPGQNAGADAGGTEYVSLAQFLERVDAIANGLLNRGFKPGDRAAILGSTSFDWALAEWSTWRAGGVVVPIYDTSPIEVIDSILRETSAKILFTDREVAAELDVEPELGCVLLNETWEQDFAKVPDEAEREALDAIEVGRDDIASIVYTSGTTGEPQGTQIAHRNFIDLVLSVQEAWIEILNDSGRTVIFLPLAHVLARGLQMICMWAGMRISYISDPKVLIKQLPDLKPTFLVVAPRVLEKIVEAVRKQAAEKHMAPVWDAAERTAIEVGKQMEQADLAARGRLPLPKGVRASNDMNAANGPAVSKPGKLSGVALKAKHKAFDKLFYARIRALLGDELEFMLSGAAPLQPELSYLFRGMGIPVMEGYGLTETTAPVAGNRPGAIRSGTVGELVPGSFLRIDDEGRLWVKGIGVSPGYVSQEQTDAAFKDGYFNTGDLATFDDGYITITGRAKDVLVTAGGKTVAPAKWEALIESAPFVEHAVMVGDSRPYLSAILVLDKSELDTWLQARNVEVPQIAPELGFAQITDSELLEQLKKSVAKANASVSRAESVKKFRAVIVDKASEVHLITPTLKLKRPAAQKQMGALIEEMYSEPHE